MITIGTIAPQFCDLEVDPDVTVFSRAAATLDALQVVHESWFCDHIHAESIIFLASDVAHLDDTQLEALVRSSPIIQPDSKTTVIRDYSKYCFVNFNFRVED